jgi:signal peptidase I
LYKAAYQLKLPYSNVALFRTGLPKPETLSSCNCVTIQRIKNPFFKRIMGLPGEIVEMRENRVIINGRAIPVRELNPADFAWVPKAHPIGLDL